MTKSEFEEYLKMLNAEFDHNAMWPGIARKFAKEIAAIADKKAEKVAKTASLVKAREMAKAMLEKGISASDIASISGLSMKEIKSL